MISSWGFLAHKTLQQVSIYALPEPLGAYFYANQDYLVNQSIRPDVRRNEDKTEDVKHYLDMDAAIFGPNYTKDIPHEFSAAVAKYGLDSLRKEGLVPWEVVRVYGRLVNAFKREMKDSVLFYAADLGHYVADAHVPLHTTKNHDGQLTGQKGLHALWESLVPEEQLSQYNLATYQAKPLVYISKPQDFIFEILLESHAMLPDLFQVEKEVTLAMGADKKHMQVVRNGRTLNYYTKEFIQAYGNKLGAKVQDRMLVSAHRVASFWYSAYKDAGSPAWVNHDAKISQELKGAFQAEKKAWLANTLISDKLLISVKNKKAE
ncbi:zinc dependent phospholipase C family protein [Aquirufa sp. Wall-65K1]